MSFSHLHHRVDERSNYRTDKRCYVWEWQNNSTLELKKNSLTACMISMFFCFKHTSVSSIHIRCCIFHQTTENSRNNRGNSTHHKPTSALLQVKANRSSAILGAFQLPQGIIKGLWWGRQLLQMLPQTFSIQGNYSQNPVRVYSTDVPKKSCQSTPK